jgi:hypothetical protein
LPGTQAGSNLLRKHLRIAGGLEGLLRDEAGCLMVAVSITLVALESRNDYQRTLRANDADDIAEYVFRSPFIQSFVQPLRESVIDDGREVLAIEAVVAIGSQQFLCPQNSHRIEELVAENVGT